MKILSQWKLNYHKFEFRTTIKKKKACLMHVYLNRIIIQSLYNFCTSKDYTDSSN